MTTIALAVVIAGQVGLIAWLVTGRIADARNVADERVAHTATNGRLERTGFELEQTKAALTEAQRVNSGLEEVLAQYINAAPNADLARGDVLSRLVRAANRQTEAAGDGASGPAAGDSVSARTAAATSKPEAAEVLPAGQLDPKESLL